MALISSERALVIARRIRRVDAVVPDDVLLADVTRTGSDGLLLTGDDPESGSQ
jgi:hypothetical protein